MHAAAKPRKPRRDNYHKVFDSRKRRVRGLWQRYGHYHANLTMSDVPKDRLKPMMPSREVVGNADTFWHHRWSRDEARPSHFLVNDYSPASDISGLIYTARTDRNNGHVKDYEVYVSRDGHTWNSPAAKGSFDRAADMETIRVEKPVTGRYLKFVALNEPAGHAYATIAELQPITDELL